MQKRQHTNLSDEELLAAYRQSKNNEWIGFLLQRYTMMLLGVAMKYLKDKDQAEDAVQQVFLKTLTHLPQGEIQNFKGWLYVLMRNYCLQNLRVKTYNAPEETLQNVAATDIKNELQEREYTLDQMNDAMNELNKDQKNTLELFHLKKMSYQQIMEQTGFDFMQVKSHIQNGKRNLKQILLKKLSERKT